MTKAYEVKKVTYTVDRQWAVLATFRHFNQTIARYATKEQADRRARLLNRETTVPGFKKI